ncbi:MAG TPA: methyltransferase [Sphingomicrobium sp.]|nr:methyltransferase [Sphingomicrobium sp.]
MRTLKLLTLSLAIAGASTLSTGALAKPADVAAAVAATANRSEDNVKLDEGRKPAEVLSFLGLQSGMQAIDMFGGNRYWAEIMAPAVGPKGHVTVWEPTQFYGKEAAEKFAALQAKVPNTHLLVTPFEALALPENSYDFMMINLNYHDVYWESAKYGVVKMEPDAFLKTVYASMKPGGIVGVIDHVGNAGDTRQTVEKYHRIDPTVVKADFEKAGFKLEAESDILKNPADDHSLLVFDPKIRGKTDRFVYKFRKPK